MKKYLIKFMYIYTYKYIFVYVNTYIYIYIGFPGGTSGKEPACQCRRYKRPGFYPWVGKIPRRREWQPTPAFLLGNPMDRGAWKDTVHGVAELDIT